MNLVERKPVYRNFHHLISSNEPVQLQRLTRKFIFCGNKFSYNSFIDAHTGAFVVRVQQNHILCRDKANTIIYTCIVLLQVSRLPILLSGSRFNALTETGITKTIILVSNPLNTDWLFNLVLYNNLAMG